MISRGTRHTRETWPCSNDGSKYFDTCEISGSVQRGRQKKMVFSPTVKVTLPLERVAPISHDFRDECLDAPAGMRHVRRKNERAQSQMPGADGSTPEGVRGWTAGRGDHKQTGLPKTHGMSKNERSRRFHVCVHKFRRGRRESTPSTHTILDLFQFGHFGCHRQNLDTTTQPGVCRKGDL